MRLVLVIVVAALVPRGAIATNWSSCSETMRILSEAAEDAAESAAHASESNEALHACWRAHNGAASSCVPEQLELESAAQVVRAASAELATQVRLAKEACR